MLNQKELDYLWLDSFMIPLKKKAKIIEACGGISFVKEKFKKNSDLFSKFLDKETISKMEACLDESYIEKLVDSLNKYYISVVTIESESYPKLLKEIADPPLVLYARGDVSLMNEKCLAMVGTRRATSYGREVTNAFAKKLSKAGLIMVSGLAFGIDTCVAESVVNIHGKTIAVLGGGLDSIYPSQNDELSRRIVRDGGLLLSEYPVGVRPTQYSFLERNRIISGLSLGTIVVEAGERSGAISTANDAIDQNRELFVIPGNITSLESLGCNNLIYSYPEAFCSSVNQILERFGLSSQESIKKADIQFSIEAQKILDALNEEMDVDELAQLTNLAPKILMSELSKLEIGGIIKKTSGNYYAKITLQN
ncbi:MAG: DNA-processing protein DprA [Clostridia bacterium]|nr:DNA-processing protein DprA [Clostridia bacterium]